MATGQAALELRKIACKCTVGIDVCEYQRVNTSLREAEPPG